MPLPTSIMIVIFCVAALGGIAVWGIIYSLMLWNSKTPNKSRKPNPISITTYYKGIELKKENGELVEIDSEEVLFRRTICFGGPDTG